MSKQVVALTDVVGYSSPIRTSEDRTLMRNTLYEVTINAFGTDHDTWYSDRGDGMLIVLPDGVLLSDVSDRFEVTVANRLARYNSVVHLGSRMSLRVALDYGEVGTDALGYNGDCMIRAGRMIDSRVFKQAMAASRATVGIITPTNLARQFGLHYNNVRTQVKGMPINASMRFL